MYVLHVHSSPIQVNTYVHTYWGKIIPEIALASHREPCKCLGHKNMKDQFIGQFHFKKKITTQ